MYLSFEETSNITQFNIEHKTNISVENYSTYKLLHYNNIE